MLNRSYYSHFQVAVTSLIPDAAVLVGALPYRHRRIWLHRWARWPQDLTHWTARKGRLRGTLTWKAWLGLFMTLKEFQGIKMQSASKNTFLNVPNALQVKPQNNQLIFCFNISKSWRSWEFLAPRFLLVLGGCIKALLTRGYMRAG